MNTNRRNKRLSFASRRLIRALTTKSFRPIDSFDIDRVDPLHARSILVMPGEEADADAQVLRTVLALANSALRHQASYHVIAVLRDPNHAAITHATTSGLDIDVVVVDELIARMMAQCCLNPKLLPVFEELLTYAGNEIYVSPEDRLTWTIRLRDGLKWHDGERVLARDCIASLKRWSVRDNFGGLLARSVDAWEAPDDRTLRIRLKQPFEVLITDLAVQ